jgi:hypothetical protein
MPVKLPPLPVFMRIGDGTEYQVGTFTPDVTLGSDGTAQVTAGPALAGFLRRVEDAIRESGLPGPVDRTGRRWADLSEAELRAYGFGDAT